MANHRESPSRAGFTILCLVCGLMLSAITSLGQPRAPDASLAGDEHWTGRPSGERLAQLLAQSLLVDFDVVVVGRFGESPHSLDPLQPEQVTIAFEPTQVFKGPLAEGLTVEVEMVSDMLVFPGGDQSRYAVRLQMRQDLLAERDELTRQTAALEQDYQAGVVTSDAYERSMEGIREREQRRRTASIELPYRAVRSTHGETFYDANGAIRPEEEYLVALNMSTHDFNTFTLKELRSVFWGELAEDVRSELERLQTTGATAPR